MKKIKINIPKSFRIIFIIRSIITQVIDLLQNLSDEINELKNEIKKLKQTNLKGKSK